MLWSLFFAHAMAEELPLPEAPRRAPAAPLADTELRLPEVRPGGAFWVPHRVTRGFLYAEGVGAALALGGGITLLAESSNASFIVGEMLLVSGAVVGLSAVPGALVSETIATKNARPASRTGIFLAWAGFGLVLISPVASFAGLYEATPWMLVGGATLATVGTPIQFAANERAFTHVVLLPTPNGLALAGQW